MEHDYVNRSYTRRKIKIDESIPKRWLCGDALRDKERFSRGWTGILEYERYAHSIWMCVRTMCTRVRMSWVERLTCACEGFLCCRETLSEIAVDNTTIQRAWHARRGFRRKGRRMVGDGSRAVWRGEGKRSTDDERVDFEQTLKSRQF